MYLSHAIRSVIVKAMLSHRFDAEFETLNQEQYALAQRAYERLYSASTRKRIDKLPKGWLPSSNYITVASTGHGVVYLDFGPSEQRSATSRRFRACDGYALAITDPGDDLLQDVLSYRRRRDSTKGACRELAWELERTLEGFKTVKSLIAGFPEAEAFVPKPAGANAPVARTRDLAKRLRLPPEG